MGFFDLSKEEEERASELHRKAIIIDGLLPWANLDYPKYMDQIRQGGVTAGNVTVSQTTGFQEALDNINHYKGKLEENPDRVTLATTVSDIMKAKEEGKLGAIFGFQDTKPIDDKLSNIQLFKDRGVRIMQLTYNAQNYVGTGCCELTYGKLTYFGLEVVEELNKQGVIIDLSHCCDEVTVDAIEHSKDPVLITHSSVYSLCNAYGRNKKNEHIEALAEKGGVIGICFAPIFIKRNPETYEVQSCTVNDVLDHIDYVVKLAGVDHVGFGSDMCGKWLDDEFTPPTSSLRHWRPLRPDVFGRGPTEKYDPFPEGLDRHHKLINLTRGLVHRGYSDEDIEKILGGNFLRVFKEVWGE